jgi:kinesin family protein 3/17
MRHCHVVLLLLDKCVALLQDGHIRVGKLNLVDLAGSERQSKTGATGAHG